MGNVYVITGGGSGIGLATARQLGGESTVVIAGRTLRKLEAAAADLRQEGISAVAVACDVANPAAVEKLAARAAELGRVAAVVHSAGLSPHMGEPRVIMEGNALGTIHVNEAFAAVMSEGACIVDVSSMAGHIVPGIVLPSRDYRLSLTDHEQFLDRMMARVSLFPKGKQSGVAYAISKNFVLWYAKADAVRRAREGIRVLSVSPGTFETPIAKLEKEATAKYTEQSPLGRIGRPEEMAHVIAFCVSDKASYLTGVDILCDGGATAGSPPLSDRLKEAASGLWSRTRKAAPRPEARP